MIDVIFGIGLYICTMLLLGPYIFLLLCVLVCYPIPTVINITSHCFNPWNNIIECVIRPKFVMLDDYITHILNK